jgi:hypothetical protein
MMELAGASTIGVRGAKKGIGGTFAVVNGAEAAKGEGVAEGGSNKTEVRGSTIEIGETGLVIMFVIITGAEAVNSKVIRFAGDEVSGGIESTEAVVCDRAIPSSSLSTLLTSSSGILSFSVACCLNSLLGGSNFFLCRTCHNSAESLQLAD